MRAACCLGALLLLAPLAGVASALDCPKGTTPNGEETPDVSEAWCEAVKDGKTVQHGPYKSWWPNGTLGNEGQFEYGQQTGRWQAWYETGELQADETYNHGRKIRGRYFDKQGHEIAEPKT